MTETKPDINAEFLKNIPALSWEQRSTGELQIKMVEARAAEAEALSKVDPEVLKLQIKSRRHWMDRLPFWATGWLVLVLSWIFLMMTFRKDVWPK